MATAALLNAFSYQASLGLRIFDYFPPGVLWDMDARGAPFIYYYSWTAFPASGYQFVWVESLVNVLIALTCSFLFGLGLNFISSKHR
jgi:hypothetical protein